MVTENGRYLTLMVDYMVTETTNFGTFLTDAIIQPTMVDLLSGR